LDNGWYVVERSVAIGSKPMACHVLDEPIVLVRSSNGELIALEDRCPHQGVPLSHGRLGPKGLMCRYHGWSFNAEGRCTGMLGLDADPPEDIRVRRYRTQERSGLIWISRGSDALLSVADPTILLWEKKLFLSAAELQQRLSERDRSDGSVVQVDLHGPLGCSARITLCVTPETARTTRVFAGARIDSRWLPDWLALRVIIPTLRARANPISLLGGDLSI
jgi:nitrite reductase/ring-hydroxylating ferredoxin subunit